MRHCETNGALKEHDYLILSDCDETWLKMSYTSPEERAEVTTSGNTIPVSFVLGEVKVTGTQSNNQLSVERIDAPLSKIMPAPPSTVVLDDQAIAVVLIGFSSNPNTFEKAEVWEAIFGESRSMNAFYQEASFGAFNIVGFENPDGDVIGPFNLPNSGCSDAGGYQEAAKAARDAARNTGHDIDAYDKVMHVFTTGGQGCPGGGIAGGRYAKIFVDMRGVWDYGAHEMAHCYGIGHASSSKNCSRRSGDEVTYGGSCEHDEYGDMSDIMGGRNFMFCSYHMERLGWFPEENSETLRNSERFTLWAINRPAEGIQSLYAESDDHLFHFEFRRQTGFDEHIEDGLTDGILIRTAQMGRGNPHIIDMTPENDFRDAALRVGSTFKDNGLEVTTVEVTDEYAVVDVVIDGQDIVAARSFDLKSPSMHGFGSSFSYMANGTPQTIPLPHIAAGRMRNVSILTPAGQRIRTLRNLVWDGRTKYGTTAAPVMYILRLETENGGMAARKLKVR